MSRQRFIYPDLFDSEKFASLSLGARVLFVALFATADDYGRGRGSLRAMRASAFPHDDFTLDQIGTWLGEIKGLPSSNGDLPWLETYEVAGQQFYQLPGWSNRQRPRYHASSSIPEKPKPEHPQNQPDRGSSGDPPANPRRSTGGSAAEVKRRGVEEKRGRRGVGVEEGLKRSEVSQITPKSSGLSREEYLSRLRSAKAKAADESAK